MKTGFSAFLIGILFALGLGISGMTLPDKVLGFLDVAGTWDPSLAFVMIGAIAVHWLFYRSIVKRPSPLFASAFQIPTKREITSRLVAGAALFGIGWGLIGICPGPALTSLATGLDQVFVFVAAMAAGMISFSWIEKRVTAFVLPRPFRFEKRKASES